MNLPGILAKARHADCPRCGSDPLEDCWPGEWHLERIIRARDYGWVSEAELGAVLAALTVFSIETAFRYVPARAA
jgi:hypothetical protein